jgi:hypothetical protein
MWGGAARWGAILGKVTLFYHTSDAFLKFSRRMSRLPIRIRWKFRAQLSGKGHQFLLRSFTSLSFVYPKWIRTTDESLEGVHARTHPCPHIPCLPRQLRIMRGRFGREQRGTPRGKVDPRTHKEREELLDQGTVSRSELRRLGSPTFRGPYNAIIRRAPKTRNILTIITTLGLTSASEAMWVAVTLIIWLQVTVVLIHR